MTYVAPGLFLLITLVAAAMGARFNPGVWSESLETPAFTPPNWLIPIVWTVLYTMIAVAGWRVWIAAGRGRAIRIWGIGLALNALWS